MEIERKFLVKSLPRLRPGSGSKIRQGYFQVYPKTTEIRLRQLDGRCCLTIKSGRGKIRVEEEFLIPKHSFEVLWPLVRHASVVKRRYRIGYGSLTIEADVYQGGHRGLITAEVEFPSKRASESFEPPQWFGREITGNRRYANVALARRYAKEDRVWHSNSRGRNPFARA